MAGTRLRMVISSEVQVQIDAVLELHLKSVKRGKSSVVEKESSKNQGKSVPKSVVQLDQPPSENQRGGGLEVVVRLASSPTFNASEFRNDLVDNLSSYVDKIEDVQLDELAATWSAMLANRLVSICFEYVGLCQSMKAVCFASQCSEA